MRCESHPGVETNLRCGKCGKPICPRCLVQTPVGARCPACARLYKLPTYRVPPAYYLRALGTALGMGVVAGFVWAVVVRIMPFFIEVLLAAGIGYGIGEVVGLSVNRKRGRGLATVAGFGVVISYLVAVLIPGGGLPFGLLGIMFDLLAVGVGVYFAVNRLR